MAHSWSFANDVPSNSRSGITDGGGPLPPGSRFGPFQIDALLDEGSSGRVYRARDPRGRVLALKVVKARLGAAARERFLREGALLAQLDHPGIVRVLSGGEVEGVPFLACELIEAPGSFRRVLERATLRARVRMVRDLADAAGHAHQRGVVHRDLKPENVLIDAQGRVRLADLGLALAGGVERLTRTGEVLGTPLYMAPEQTQAGAAPAPTMDVWALGVILYEALSGQRPFQAPGWIELRALIQRAQPTPLRQLAPTLPPELDAVCARALARDPSARFATGAALAKALDALLARVPEQPGPALEGASPQATPLRTPIGLGQHGRFDVRAELGRGGMGVVYRALDTELGREVALKVILADRGNTKRLERFRREGELTATLSHPGILKVHSMGVLDETPYIVYELVEGARTLDEVLPPLDRRAGVALIRDAARALGYAHQQGVVHRDVKPDNLLVDADGRLLVSDFGLAAGANVERLTRTGAIVGTPHYMAPEQAAGERKRFGPHTDVWGLGVVLYQFLCGRLPFEGQTFVELGAKIVKAYPVAPRAHDPSIPKDLEAICLKALHQQPAGRYRDGTLFADDLDAFLAGRPTTATSSGIFLPRLRSSRPALALIPLAALALLAFGVWFTRRPSPTLPAADPPPVRSKSPPAPARADPADGQRAWREVESIDDPAQQLTAARRWLSENPGHPLERDARTLTARLRFAAPQQRHVLRHAEKDRAYGLFLNNGQLLTYGEDGTLKRWNAETGALLATRTFEEPHILRSLVLAPGGDRFAAGAARGGVLWGSVQGDEERLQRLRVVAHLAVSPDGRTVAVPCPSEVIEFDLGDESERRRYPVPATPTALVYSPDGARLLALTGNKGVQSAPPEASMWSTSSGELLAHQRLRGLGRVAAFSPTGDRLIVGTSTGSLLTLDPATLETTGAFESLDEARTGGDLVQTAHRGSVKGLAFTAHGSLVYSCSQGGMGWARELRVWDAATGRPLRSPILSPHNLDGLAFSPDETLFALASEDGVVEVWSRE